jgi:hypothetical protein
VSERKYTPDKWGRVTGVQVWDPDGWRVDGKSFDEAVTFDEYMRRAVTSTVMNVRAFMDERLQAATRKYSTYTGGRFSIANPNTQVLPTNPCVRMADEILKYEVRVCRTCDGAGQIVVDHSWSDPHGILVQCPDPDCTS